MQDEEIPQTVNEIRATPSNCSASVGNLAAALAKAQGAMRPSKKDSFNPHFKSHYADIVAVWESARVALAENALSVTQTTSLRGDLVVLVTTLLHASGEWISGEYPVRTTQATPQG